MGPVLHFDAPIRVGPEKHKEGVRSGKKQMRIEVEDLAILPPPEYEGRVSVVRLDQRYA